MPQFQGGRYHEADGSRLCRDVLQTPDLQESSVMSAALEAVLTPELRSIPFASFRKSIPKLAKCRTTSADIQGLITKVETTHNIILGDARETSFDPGSVHLVVTSPPYWTLKEYPARPGQIGRLGEYQEFLDSLKDVWRNCFDALVPGGRLVCVVGDVCLSRRKNGGRHTVVPLHASIQNHCTEIGFDNLAPIIWHKISNLKTEVSNGSGSYLGKPYEPNGVVKNDIEFILMLRKPGGYRSPSPAARLLSVISAEDHERWFRQIWNDIPGASTRDHPAPFPVELAERLVRMFSFVGDTVLDPFTGTASSQVAARNTGRNSLGVEVEPAFRDLALKRLGG